VNERMIERVAINDVCVSNRYLSSLRTASHWTQFRHTTSPSTPYRRAGRWSESLWVPTRHPDTRKWCEFPAIYRKHASCEPIILPDSRSKSQR